MRILIANDDGVYSPGIHALAEVAREFGDVRVVAPDVEMSSASHSITASRPLSYKRTPIKGIEAYRVNGTPGDCVALGSHHWDKVDVVLSGINLGPNLGNGLWHSGTLAGAKQAALLVQGRAGPRCSTDPKTRDSGHDVPPIRRRPSTPEIGPPCPGCPIRPALRSTSRQRSGERLVRHSRATPVRRELRYCDSGAGSRPPYRENDGSLVPGL